jgi:hypothetical protein
VSHQTTQTLGYDRSSIPPRLLTRSTTRRRAPGPRGQPGWRAGSGADRDGDRRLLAALDARLARRRPAHDHEHEHDHDGGHVGQDRRDDPLLQGAAYASGSRALAATGTPADRMVGGAILLVLLGGSLVLVARRRRSP